VHDDFAERFPDERVEIGFLERCEIDAADAGACGERRERCMRRMARVKRFWPVGQHEERAHVRKSRYEMRKKSERRRVGEMHVFDDGDDGFPLRRALERSDEGDEAIVCVREFARDG